MTKSKTINIKRLQHKATAKADKVKAIKRTKRRTKRQLKQIRKYLELKLQISQSSLHLQFATTFLIFILIFIYLLFDLLDHHFQTFTLKNLRVCEKHYSLQTTALNWAKTAVTQLTNPESTRFPRNPETRPDIFARDLHRSISVPIAPQLKESNRNSENNTKIDSFHVSLT